MSRYCTILFLSSKLPVPSACTLYILYFGVLPDRASTVDDDRDQSRVSFEQFAQAVCEQLAPDIISCPRHTVVQAVCGRVVVPIATEGEHRDVEHMETRGVVSRASGSTTVRGFARCLRGMGLSLARSRFWINGNTVIHLLIGREPKCQI